MEFNTSQLNSSILNALAFLAEKDKALVVEAFDNAMSHMDCNHTVCQNVGKDIADLIDSEDWNELSIFLDYGHLEYDEDE